MEAKKKGKRRSSIWSAFDVEERKRGKKERKKDRQIDRQKER